MRKNGRLLIKISKNASLIIGIGSGTINDLCGFLSYKLNISYIIFSTAPSIDEYASMEALIISGVAIGFVGYSRPASGAEHHLAHYWEMNAISKNIPHPLHGNSVGVGTVVVSMIYQLMKDKLPTGLTPPDPEYLISIHKMVGSIYNPKELGIPKDVFQDSIIHAREIRNRYTIFQLAHEFNLLEKISTILTEKFYG